MRCAPVQHACPRRECCRVVVLPSEQSLHGLLNSVVPGDRIKEGGEWRSYGWDERKGGGPLPVEARFVDEMPQISSLRCIQNRYSPVLCNMISLPYFICRLNFLVAPLAGEIVTLTCSTMLQVFSSQWVSLGPASFPS